ncbi:hypothetical protein KBX21_13950 [Nocardiopsis sp. B62]|nr:hypothetical protein [Nocardiopsis sp. B62]
MEVGGVGGEARRVHRVDGGVDVSSDVLELKGQLSQVPTQSLGSRTLELLVARLHILGQGPHLVVAGSREVAEVAEVGLNPAEDTAVEGAGAHTGGGGGVEDVAHPVDEIAPHRAVGFLDGLIDVDARVDRETPLVPAEQFRVGGPAVETEPLVRALGVVDVPEELLDPAGVMHRLGGAHGRGRSLVVFVGEDVDGVCHLFAPDGATGLGDRGIGPLLLWKVLVSHASSSGRVRGAEG